MNTATEPKTVFITNPTLRHPKAGSPKKAIWKLHFTCYSNFFLSLTDEEREQQCGPGAMTSTMERWVPILHYVLARNHPKEALPQIMENVTLEIADVYLDLGITKEEVLEFIDYTNRYTAAKATKH